MKPAADVTATRSPAQPRAADGAPKLLVSVRDVAEADAALAGGADWIDLKEPLRGPLGAVDSLVAADVATHLDGCVPLSAAAGELLDWPSGESKRLLDVPGVSLLKLGLSRCRGARWQDCWIAAREEITQTGRDLVAVVYADAAQADAPSALELLRVAAEAGTRWLLIDTFDKQAGWLGNSMSFGMLTDVLERAGAAGLATVVAGSVTSAVLHTLPLELVDMIAVRGAVCEGDRIGRVNAKRVAKFCSILRSQRVRT